ncbi:signal recognition particle-docking protein FtsY [Rosenbergiella collisarenosi]|uniref:signal recognition particle-docking protein FtsY n=1 Tax=Rosenbergiella collisarenosi TaxID=1544695 RepID=UPI001F4D9A8D|nr:signal recognition particle-docking protein FtsY [Rosenbergiella collisarenosi]
MAKEKKRGFFSWLGFGKDEEKQPAEDDIQAVEPEQVASSHEEAAQHQQEERAPQTELDQEYAAQQQTSPAAEISAENVEEQSIVDSERSEASSLPTEPEPEPEPEPELTANIPQPLQDIEEIDKSDVLGTATPEPQNNLEDVSELAAITPPKEQERPTKAGFFARLKQSLVRTRQNLGSGFVGLFRGKKIDDDLFEELEEQLLIADVGMDTTQKIIRSLTAQANRKQLKDAEALYSILKDEMAAILHKVEQPLSVEGKNPFVILMVGVNGVGKTTTIGKLAKQYQSEGKSVMLAAGDTFRAAAVEQLQVWGERNNIPVIAQHTGADSASVIFDAIQAAKSRGVDILIADTAGRLQNKSHLMEELKKITRVMGRLDEDAPHEVMLTLDASTGQNAISQAKLFNEAVGLTGISLTKLDGTAKGGVIFSIADQFGIPIRYIGVGEGIDDLRPFQAEDFIEALFAREE